MGIVHVLDPFTSNCIAAGEVIERPSSVVKELLENSIDAGATAITVEIRQGGIEMIRVTDNGSGFLRQDAEIAFARHATSKISSAEDLQGIRTLGFRGEALASIAAVSKTELLSRTRDAQIGFHLTIQAGEVQSNLDAGCPEGSTMIVSDLFYNVPVRLKFLKRPATEAGYVADCVARQILCNPSASIKLVHNEKIVYHSPGNGELKSAIYSIYGADALHLLKKIQFEQEGIRVEGYLGLPDAARGNRGAQSVLINGRYVQCDIVSRAAESAFDTRIMAGKFPMFVLSLTLDPHRLDVNVHPNKLQVRLRDEECVHRAVSHAALGALESNSALAALVQTEQPEPMPTTVETPVVRPDPSVFIGRKEQALREEQSVFSSMWSRKPNKREGFADIEASKEQVLLPQPGADRQSAAPVPGEEALAQPASGRMRIIGQVFSSYLLIEDGDELLLVDQHAAHERLIYQRLCAAIEAREQLSQKLLVPQVIRISPLEKAWLEDNRQIVEGLGFEWEDFGGNSCQIRAVPFIFGQPEVKGFFFDLVARISEFRSLRTVDAKRAAITQMACKAAVKAGQQLSFLEARTLMDMVADENAPLTCPHGRPILIRMTHAELDKRFKRI